MPRIKILAIDDDPDLLNIVKTQLKFSGYDVITAYNGEEGIHLARTESPDLIVVDLLMPVMDGFEVCRRLRQDRMTYLTPIIMLTASGTQMDKISALKGGVDDFITKPFAPNELDARIEGLIRRFHQSRSSNPLTGLPGNMSIEQEINKRIYKRDPLAVAYIDIDNFKAFNDKYGYDKGDDIIQLVARILINAAEELGRRDDFIGHIGGDDYIFITTPDRVESIASYVIKWFDELVPTHYNEEDRLRGHIEVINRQGQVQHFPIMSVSIGICTNEHRTLHSALQVSEICAEVKKAAKKVKRSNFVLDRRRDEERHEEVSSGQVPAPRSPVSPILRRPDNLPPDPLERRGGFPGMFSEGGRPSPVRDDEGPARTLP
ncbi:MAG: response regulator [Armatimonadetes bacterium]|nr:response regulator [Armatimonadota bacterium]